MGSKRKGKTMCPEDEESGDEGSGDAPQGQVTEFPCPRCQKPQKEFPIIGEARSPMCMECKTLVSAAKIPPELITKRAAAARDRHRSRTPPKQTPPPSQEPVKEEEAEFERHEEPEDEEEAPAAPVIRSRGPLQEPPARAKVIFDTPPTPHQILENILTEFDLDDAFIKLMVSRSKRQNGVHPTDLRYYLKTLNSGIPRESRDDMAAYIADEYFYALTQAKSEADRMRAPVTYPLYAGEAKQPGAPPVGRSLGYDGAPRQYMSPQRQSYREDVGGYYQEQPQGRPLTAEEVAKIMDERIARQAEKTRMDELQREIRDRDMKFTEKLAELNKQSAENMEKLIGKVQSSQAGFLTPGDLEKFTLEREREFQRTIADQNMKMTQMMMDFQKAQIDGLQKQNQSLVDELKRGPKIEPGDFKSDEARLAATAMDKAADALSKREPVKIVIEGVTRLAGVESAPEEIKKKTKTARSRISELVGQEFSEGTKEEKA